MDHTVTSVEPGGEVLDVEKGHGAGGRMMWGEGGRKEKAVSAFCGFREMGVAGGWGFFGITGVYWPSVISVRCWVSFWLGDAGGAAAEEL